jgi:hypothetical protein
VLKNSPRVSKIKHSAKRFFAECFLLPRVFYVALVKELLCQVPEKNTQQSIWYSAKSQIMVVHVYLNKSYNCLGLITTFVHTGRM